MYAYSDSHGCGHGRTDMVPVVGHMDAITALTYPICIRAKMAVRLLPVVDDLERSLRGLVEYSYLHTCSPFPAL